MKSITRLLSLSLITLTLAFTSGCASGGLPWKPTVTTPAPPIPVVVEIPAATNSVTVPAVLDDTGKVVKAEGRIDVVTPAKLLTNWVEQVSVEVNPIWQKSIAGAQSANAALNPTPTAPLINWGLGLLATVLGGVAKWQQDKANKKTDLLHTVILGVEQVASPEMKAKIAEYAEAKSQYDALHAEVNAVTR